MNCPNCKLPFVEEKEGKFRCDTCGWLEKVGDEWRACEPPQPEMSPEPEPEPEPQPRQEPNPAELEPNPAAQEPSPDPKRKVRKILGGLITITEVD